MRKERAPANVHRNAKVLKVGKKFLYNNKKNCKEKGWFWLLGHHILSHWLLEFWNLELVDSSGYKYMYVYKIRVKKNRNFFEIPAALFFFILQTKIQKKWYRGGKGQNFYSWFKFSSSRFSKIIFCVVFILVYFYPKLVDRLQRIYIERKKSIFH